MESYLNHFSENNLEATMNETLQGEILIMEITLTWNTCLFLIGGYSYTFAVSGSKFFHLKEAQILEMFPLLGNVTSCLHNLSKQVAVDQLDAPSHWRPGGRRFNHTEVGNILSWRLIMKYFLQSFSPFRWFKKGSCQFLAKECAQYWLTA